MKWFKGWPVTYMGIASLAAGCWMNSGIDAGLIVGGMCVIGAGIAQLVTSDD